MIIAIYAESVHAQDVRPDSIATDSIAAVMLDEINITASRITDTPTGYRMSVAGSKLTKGKDTSTLLGFLPNISRKDGTFQINGLAVTEITIDGRRVDNIDELKEIPAEYIESLEVSYIAKASQITESAGGSISITLKQAPQMGYYGAIQGSIATEFRKNTDDGFLYGSVSARIGKISIYEAMSGGRTQGVESYDNISSSIDREDRRNMRTLIRHDAINNTMALGYEISNGHSILLNWKIASRKSSFSDGERNALFIDMKSKNKNPSNIIALNYSGNLGDKAGRLSFAAEWMGRQSHDDQILYDNGSIYSNPENKNTSDLFRLSVDWERTLGKSHSLNTGVAYDLADLSVIRSDNVKDYLKSGTQNITAQTIMPYIAAQGKVGRFGYYAGLSWQSNRLCVDNMNPDVRSALNPSVQLSLPLDHEGLYSLTALYRHTLEKMPYDAISDKEVWMDANSYSVGNRGLRPRKLDYASLMAKLFRGNLMLSASASRIADQIVWETFSDPRSLSVTYTKPVNIDHPYWRYSLNAEFNRTFFGCWTLKGSVYLSFCQEHAKLEAGMYNNMRFRQYYSISNSLSLGKGWGGSAKAYLEPTYRSLDRTYHKVWQVDLRVYKSFLKEDLYVWIDLVPCGKRRRLDRVSADRKVSMSYTTPAQSMSLTVQYYFRGGKKDISVRTGQTSVGYNEISDSK